jgi:hypothetical protein
LQTALNGGSLTSSIGASNKGNSGKVTGPIEGICLFVYCECKGTKYTCAYATRKV